MEQKHDDDPGRFRSEWPYPLPSGPSTVQFTTHKASTAAVDSFSCRFEDTFAEAAEPKLPDVIHNCYKVAYSFVLNSFYIFLSVILGPIFVLAFGLILGLTSFMISFILSPLFRLTGMCFGTWQRFITSILSCFLVPYCNALGGLFSKIVIRYQQVPAGEVIQV